MTDVSPLGGAAAAAARSSSASPRAATGANSTTADETTRPRQSSSSTTTTTSLPYSAILSSPSSGSTGESSLPTSSCTSSTVASLLQSVAKMSLLDHYYSHDQDDDDDDEDCGGNQAGTVQRPNNALLFANDEYDQHDTTTTTINAAAATATTASLQSLQKKALPAMPDEQDRKRFLGCLAAVLASLYEYDQEEEKDSNNNYNVQQQQQQQQSSVSMDYPPNLCTPFSTSHHTTSSSTSHGLLYEYEDLDELDISQNSNNRSNDSFDYEAPSSTQQGNNKPQVLRRSNSNSSRQRQSSGTNHYPKSPSSAPSSSSTTTTKVVDAASLAQQRHRQRRYEVYAKFLASSAEWLQLDESQGKCFVPMLSKLLVPQPRRQRHYNGPRQQQTLVAAAHDDLLLSSMLDDIEHLRVFWEALSPGAGLRCLTLFVLQHLLHSTTGYDARIRHAVKTVGVWVLMHDRLLQQRQQDDDGDTAAAADGTRRSATNTPERRRYWTNPRHDDDDDTNCQLDWVTQATRQFESLEHCIALKLIELSKAQQELEKQHAKGKRSSHNNKNSNTKHSGGRLASRDCYTNGSSRDRFIRGLKIGGTAVAAGTLFAITGGLAAPGIAAGVATIVGTTAVATAAAALTSTVAVTTIFGVGGGGLVAYKMQRRTVGLTEFEFCKEESPYRKQQRREAGGDDDDDDDSPDAELFSTICMSGWLRDDHDFQRPWGIMPSRPPLGDRLELLERFYAIHKPGHILKCPKVLESWRGEEEQLWTLLRRNYGRDPDHLFPLDDGPRYRAGLTHEQQEVVDQIFVQLGCTVSESRDSGASVRTMKQRTPFERMQLGQQGFHQADTFNTSLMDSLHGPHSDDLTDRLKENGTLSMSSMVHDGDIDKDEAKLAKIKHLATVWDYQMTYGGELYSVRWESKLLEELCYSVVDLASDVVTGATGHLLKFTALSALAAAMALPVALKSAANMIDGTWTLVVERTDEAGAELAKSLLFSSAGHRPVSLVGFSFGARAIYSCLKELAIYQEKWEDYQERSKRASSAGHGARHRFRKPSTREETDAFFENMREPASIVGDVILMGLPNHLSLSSWKACRRVVAGRLVNCYSRKDLILSLMYQIKKFGLKPVCGTCAVNVPGVENLDVTDLVSGHQDYTLVAGEILKRARHGEPFRSESAGFGWEDVGVVEEERRQMVQLRAMKAQER